MTPAVHSVVYVAAAVVFLVVAAGTWRRRAARPVAAACLVAIAVGGAWWSLADAVIATGVGAPASGMAATATFPGIGLVVAAFACVGRSVQGAEWAPSRGLILALGIEPVLATAAVATNPWHLAFYRGPGSATSGTPNLWLHAPLFWVHAGYSYALIAVGFGMLAHAWRTSPPVFGRQYRSLLIASLVPVLATGVDLTGKAGAFGDPTPLGLALAALVLGYAVRRQELIALAPVAREDLFERIGDAVVALNLCGRVIDANPAAEAIWRAATATRVDDALVGQPARGLLDRLKQADPDMTFRGDDDRARCTVSVGGRRTDLEIRGSGLTDGHGRPIGRVFVARDVTEVDARNRELMAQVELSEGLRRDLVEQASRDPLTHLHNRRHVMDRFEPMLAETRPGDAVSVLMVDIDRFKAVNDEHGHLVGDVVLVAMGQRLLQVMPSCALVARWGGEEFVVVLPRTDAAVGIGLAEQLRDLCGSEPLEGPGVSVRCTVSVGVAAFPEAGRTARELLQAADTALYAAKANGRNQVCG
jgi:diguanylate cyclase (GGDEF)-like protein